MVRFVESTAGGGLEALRYRRHGSRSSIPTRHSDCSAFTTSSASGRRFSSSRPCVPTPYWSSYVNENRRARQRTAQSSRPPSGFNREQHHREVARASQEAAAPRSSHRHYDSAHLTLAPSPPASINASKQANRFFRYAGSNEDVSSSCDLSDDQALHRRDSASALTGDNTWGSTRPSRHRNSLTVTGGSSSVRGVQLGRGTTSKGRDLLEWADGAQLHLTPPARIVSTCQGYSANPAKHAAPWKRLCARGRAYFGRMAANMGLEGAGQPVPSTAGSTAPRSAASGCDASDGLRVMRQREEYRRWCRWQISNTFSRGYTYLAAIRSQVSAQEMSRQYAGRYVVPCDATITSFIQDERRRDRKYAFLRRLLRKEFGLAKRFATTVTDEEKKEDSIQDEDGSAVDVTVNDDHDLEEEEHGGGGGRGDAATQPLLEICFNAHTGLLDIVVYVGGDESGEGATFLCRCSAGCLKDTCWLFLDGCWKGESLFFVDRGDRGIPAPSSQPSSMSEAGCRDITPPEYHFLIIRGVCMQRVLPPSSSVSPSDTFVCTRCASVRVGRDGGASRFHATQSTTTHNRCAYMCSICRQPTSHVKVTPSYTAAHRAISSVLQDTTMSDTEKHACVEHYVAQVCPASDEQVVAKPSWQSRRR